MTLPEPTGKRYSTTYALEGYRSSNPEWLPEKQAILGFILLHLSDLTGAQGAFREALHLGRPFPIVPLAGLGCVALAAGEPRGAAALLGAAEAKRESSKTVLWPTDHAEIDWRRPGEPRDGRSPLCVLPMGRSGDG